MIDESRLARLRADTPSCERRIHFDNAGASLTPRPVYETLLRHLALENEVGGYEAEARAAGDLEKTYASLARLLRARPEEIAYVENATRAWDMAFYALPLRPGDRVITHASEYASNYLAFLQQARRRGLEIDLAPSDPSGQIDVAAIEPLITARTRLIAITHVPTQGGLVNPAAEVGAIARKHGLLYLLDACQSVGQLDLDVTAIGCHMLSGTGRKFLRGPRGTGFLYVAGEILETLDPPFIDLRAASWLSEDAYRLAPGARRFETWESYVAGRLALGAAAEYALSVGMAAIERRVARLGERLREALADLPGARVHDLGARRCGIVTFSKEGVAAADLAAFLKAQGCAVSVSEAAYARLDLGRRGLPTLTRASVHYFNAEEEIETFRRHVAACPS